MEGESFYQLSRSLLGGTSRQGTSRSAAVAARSTRWQHLGENETVSNHPFWLRLLRPSPRRTGRLSHRAEFLTVQDADLHATATSHVGSQLNGRLDPPVCPAVQAFRFSSAFTTVCTASAESWRCLTEPARR